MIEWVIVVQRQLSNLSALLWREQVNLQWNDDVEVCFVKKQHAWLDFCSASSLKQQSADKHVAPLGHISNSEPTSLCSFSLMLLSVEATHTNCIVFGLTRLGLEPTIYRTRGEHAKHYTTDAICNWRTDCSRATILGSST